MTPLSCCCLLNPTQKKHAAAANRPPTYVDQNVTELLRRTEEKREERKKERLDAYNRKIFKDYFEFDGGTESAARARGLSAETAAAYRKWLDENK